MRPLLSLFGAIWVISFLAAPTLGAGWIWEAGNALGFAAMAGMLYLTIAGDSRRDVRAHEMLGYAVLLVALVHALWFLLFDGAAVEFLMPDAPVYMWAGIAGLLLLAVLVILAMLPTRLRVHRSYSVFRYWHLVISILVIGMAAYHIVFSGLYLRAWYQVVAFIALIVLVVLARGPNFGPRRFSMASPGSYFVVSVIGTLLFVAVRNIVT